MDHLALNGAVAEVLAVEILRLVAHAMTSIADNWDLNFRVVGHFGILAVLIGGHRDLETGGHSLELIRSAHVTILQTRPHRVDIEEGVFPMLDVCAWVPVEGLVALIADRRQV